MRSEQYIEKALLTENKDRFGAEGRLAKNQRLLHGAIGASTEAAEILDQLKKHVYYGKELDKVNLFEEVGDLFWYLALLADELGFSFDDVMEKNLEKLRIRFGDKFEQEKAVTRDLEKELGAFR
jgi:NTP pyrophosphatase (non-canonical NTP hydrolase)